MISDKDILINLKALEEKANFISTKAKENIPMTTSDTEIILPSILTEWFSVNFLTNCLYILVPIIIFSLLYYFKPRFIMDEVKIDTFLTKFKTYSLYFTYKPCYNFHIFYHKV